jgi:hypothetical protein
MPQLAPLSDLGRLLARLCLKAARAGDWTRLAEESPYLARPRTFADLLSHADKIDQDDPDIRQLYSLLREAIPDEVGGRERKHLAHFHIYI